MIKSIQFTNIKGRSARYDLNKVTVFIGENAAGKTAVLDAADWLMLGYSPKVGKTNADVFKLSSGIYMEASLDVSDGRRVARRLERKGDKVSGSATGEVEFPAVLRDSSLYFGLSPRARVALVAGLVPPGDAAGFSVAELLAAVKNIRLGENSEASEQAVLKHYNALSAIPAAAPLDWIASALEGVKESLKLATAARKRFTATSIGLVQLQSQDAEQAGTGGATEAKLRKAREELGVLQTAAGDTAARLAEARKKQARRDGLAAVAKPEVDLEGLRKDVESAGLRALAQQQAVGLRGSAATAMCATAARLAAELDAAQSDNERISKRVAELDAVQRPDVDATSLNENQSLVDAKISEMEMRVKARTKTTAEVAEGVAGWKAEKRHKLNAYIEAKDEVAALQREAAAFLSHDHCPTCLATSGTWKAAWTAAHDKVASAAKHKMDEVLAEGTRLKDAIVEAEAALAAMREQDAALAGFKAQHDAIAQTLAKHATALAAYKQAQADSERLAAERNRLPVTALRSRVAAANAARDAALLQDAELVRLRAQHEDGEAAVAAAEKSMEAWDAAQKELASTGDPGVAALETAEKKSHGEIAAKKDGISALEDRAKGVALARADLRRQMEAATASDRAQAEVDVLKAAVAMLEEKQAALVATSFGGLLKTVNRFTSTVLSHDVVYHDGECGYWRGGTFVSAATFSGVEELVMFVGLCVALAAKAEHRVVVVDEMTRAVGSTKRLVLDRIVDLVRDGTIHQAILVDGTDALPTYTDAAGKTPEISVVRVKTGDGECDTAKAGKEK